MTFKGRLENLDSEFFADGFLFGTDFVNGKGTWPKRNKRVFMGNKLRIDWIEIN